MRHAAKAALCLLVAALAVPAAWATTAVERTETELIQEAETIVTGRCIRLQSQWVERDLVTLATLSVSEVLKGQAGSEITVVLPGGIDANRPIPVAMTFPAAPEILLQEDVLLFLTGEERVLDGYSIVGFSQGKFTVVEAGGQKMATQDLSALDLQGGNGGIRRGAAKTFPLAQIRQKIQQTLAAEKPERQR
ncbi:MAG TPA: hypothetical protein VGG03_13015 [Thermoanaerobaculia bacterium]|jgi:hypothetical protein